MCPGGVCAVCALGAVAVLWEEQTRRSKIGKDTPFAGEKRKWVWTRIWKFRIMQGWTSAASRIRMLRVRRQRPGTASAPGPGRWRSERGKACTSSPEPWRLLSLREEREPPAPGLPSPAGAAGGAGLVALGSAEGCGEGTATHPLVPSCPIFLLSQPHSCPSLSPAAAPRHGPHPRRPDAGTRRPSPSAGHLVLPNTHTHTHTHTRPCAHTHTRAHTPSCPPTYVPTQPCAQCTPMLTPICTRTHARPRMCAHAHQTLPDDPALAVPRAAQRGAGRREGLSPFRGTCQLPAEERQTPLPRWTDGSGALLCVGGHPPDTCGLCVGGAAA